MSVSFGISGMGQEHVRLYQVALHVVQEKVLSTMLQTCMMSRTWLRHGLLEENQWCHVKFHFASDVRMCTPKYVVFARLAPM